MAHAAGQPAARVVVVDICNTLADVTGAVLACLGLPESARPRRYSLEGLGVREPDAWFLRHPEAFAEAAPLPGAADALDLAARSGWRVAYATARPDWAREVTLEWLREHGFPPGDLVTGADKPAVCLALRAALAVDDAPGEVRRLRRVVKVAVVGQPHNGSRATWAEIAGILAATGRKGR